MRARSALVRPTRSPSLISAWRTHSRTDSDPMPSDFATRVTAPWRSPCSVAISRTRRTARSLNSGGYRRWVGWGLLLRSAMTPSSSKEWSLHRSQDGSSGRADWSCAHTIQLSIRIGLGPDRRLRTGKAFQPSGCRDAPPTGGWHTEVDDRPRGRGHRALAEGQGRAGRGHRAVRHERDDHVAMDGSNNVAITDDIHDHLPRRVG